ncbi:hypothetical protein AGMMS49587_16540 [Spirochaetia bacterium]|nr:hypothetical protein AGMMS49587_16540 [Spirochaetia bacterium]
MSDRETRIVEVYRIEEAHALVDLARYIVKVSRDHPLDDDEADGMDYLLENIKAIIG